MNYGAFNGLQFQNGTEIFATANNWFLIYYRL